jgi:large subunit ribosomal protein L3
MAKAHAPRHGSMQFWPRKRAQREHARIRSWPSATSEAGKPLCFAGYKAGMSHIIVSDNRKTTKTKGMDLMLPVTVIECPPLKVVGARCYIKDLAGAYGLRVATEIRIKGDKELAKILSVPSAAKEKDAKNRFSSLKPEDYVDIRLLVQTQPKLTSIGKKNPEVFELGLGGKPADQHAFAKEKLGQELTINDVFKEGEQLDIHSVTKGKGTQGPVKRFGVALRSHKSEKVRRGPGNLGSWKAQGHNMYRVAHAGQMGYHLRTEWNKWLLKIETDPKIINPVGGFKRYGEVKNPFILLKGSTGGATKRLIKITPATRPNTQTPGEAPAIKYVSVSSQL